MAAAQGYSIAAEYRDRVAVTAPTRLDWTFAVAKQSQANPPPEWIGRDYDSTRQTYELFAPPKNAPGERPLVLFISHTDQAKGWQSWSEVCRRYNVIFAGPHGAGKRQNVARRIRVVLDVLDDVRQRYSVDPDRTYLCGFSDGAHIACEIAYSLPEYFGGVIAIGGGEAPPRELWLRHQMADRLSVAFIRSSRESDRRELFYGTVFLSLAALYGTST